MAISGAWALVTYRPPSGPLDFVLIDLNNAAASRFNGTPHPPAPKTAAVIGGHLYIGARHLFVTDGSAARIIGACGDRDYYVSTISEDGRLWLGTFPKGTLEIYNPQTDELTQVGEFDANFTDPQYVYSLVTDGRYAYAGMGQAPWYLAIIDTETGEATQYFKDDARSVSYTYEAADGSGFYYGRNGSWYKLENGEPTSVLSVPALKPAGQTNVLVDPLTFASAGVEFDLSSANAASGAPAVIRWRLDGGDWRQLSIDGLTRTAATLRRVVSIGNRLLVVTAEYGPLAWYDPSAQTFDVIGWSPCSLYDALVDGTDVYLSGYVATTFRWDTTQDWTLTRSTTDATQSNPRQVAAWHKYHHYQALDAGGVLWVAVTHERDSIGGTLGWYDPATEHTGSFRDGLELHAPRGLAVAGNNVVFSGGGLEGEADKLFVYDASAKAFVKAFAPVEAATASVIVAVSDTDIVGIMPGVSKAYRLNVETEAVAWQVTLPGVPFGSLGIHDRRVAVAPDGWLWFALGNAIYKLNPEDGTTAKVVDVGASYNVCFHQGKAYLYGGTTIKRINL